MQEAPDASEGEKGGGDRDLGQAFHKRILASLGQKGMLTFRAL